MAPTGPGKRKRGDRSYSGDSLHDGQRPSPHRPGNLNLAQQNQQSQLYERDFSAGRGRGGRRGSRNGGRGGHGHSNATSPIQPETSHQSPKIKSPEPAEQVVPNGDRTDSPMLSMAVTVPEPEPEMPLTDPKPFAYEYMTEEICAMWAEEGKDKIGEVFMSAIEESDDMIIAAVSQELVRSALTRRVPPDEVGKIMKKIADEETRTPGEATLSQSVFLDSISISAENEILPNSSLSSLQQVIQSSGISADLLRRELDAPLLEKLGLIRTTFARMGIRKSTNVLYRQANFNLMREESEGFAKLMTELYTTTSTEPPSAEVVEETVEKVKAMIGAFDLDVGRTLDVVLDVFGAVLIKQFRFFVKFLRASPWWPREHKTNWDADNCNGLPLWALPGNSSWYLNDKQKTEVTHQTLLRDKAFWARAREVGLQAFYELGRRRASDEDVANANLQQTDTRSLDNQWIKETKTLPPKGNRDAAQLLGFKLRFYSSSAARDDDDKLPDNLIYLSALLIKIGFITLNDLYPHLWRTDDEMETLRQHKLKEKAERERDARPGAGARNALLMAGALADDTLPMPRLREPATRSGTPSKEANPEKSTTTPAASITEPLDQKVFLLKSLLAIGALPEALFILGRFPWIIDLYPEITEYINRILHHSLDGVYATIQPLSDRKTLQIQKPIAETDVPGLPKGQVRINNAPANKVLRWALLDRADSSDGQDYRFYWDEWNDSIPGCHTVDDVFVLCGTLLNLVGVRIGQDSGLLTKFARIGRDSLKNDSSDHNRQRWTDLSKRLLLPALSFTKSNAGVVNEVFDLISSFPINLRYLMYLEWSTGRTSRLPELKGAFDQAKAETKDVLKRISKTNVKPMARSLAKIAFANPHIVITTAMSQIEVYDAIAEVFVEGARYFTDLGYDVLTWAMISSMARAGRSRTQESGLFTSKWLTALASFAGKVFKRYKLMKPGPVLEYVAEQLEDGNLTDLIMLEQIVLSMAGITTDTNYNDAQLQAMGGGPNLRSQTILQLLDRRHESSITSSRLMKSLHETKLTGKILVAMAQQRQACIYDPENASAPLKLLGNIFDEIHRIMVQYLDLLRSKLTAEEFRAAVPDTVQLLFDYQLCPEIAFAISRPLLRLRILEFDKEEADRKKEDSATPKATSNGDEEMADQANGISEEDGETLEESTPDALAGAAACDAEMIGTTLDVEDMEKEAVPGEGEEVFQPGKWHPVLKELMDSLTTRLSAEVTDIIGLGFFTTFWQLSLYDIAVAGKSYDDEVTRLKAKMKAITADRTDMTTSGMRKKEAEKKQIEILCEKLMIENREHIKASGVLKRRLDVEKTQWFAGKARIYGELNTALMEHCFLPRLLCSPIDSYFCFKFVKYLHSSGASNFRTLGFYDLVFKQDRLVSLIFACTSKEADNLGRFLNEVLRDLGRWHQTKGVYEREAFGSKRDLIGFAMKVDAGKPSLRLDFESFRRILFKWHQNVFTALNSCLSSTEYMHVRNAISVLRSISLYFPAINFHGTALRKSIEALGDSDKDDLKLSSKAIMGALNRREKAWVMPQAFRKGQEKGGSSFDTDPSRASTPQTGGKLSATAPEFKPSDTRPPTGKKADDGELKDTIMTDVTPSNLTDGKAELVSENKKAAPTSAASTSTTASTTGPDAPSAARGNASEALPPTQAVNGDGRDVRPTTISSANNLSRRHELPRRVSPVRNIRPSPSLPSRPEGGEHRNSRRNDVHIPARPAFGPDSQRTLSDGRPLNPPARPGRSDERVGEPEFERHNVYPRGHERDDRMPPIRGEYGRGQERDVGPRYPPERGNTRPQSRDIPGPSSHEIRSERSRPLTEPRNDRERAVEPRASERPPSSSATSSQLAAVAINPERAALINADLNPRPDMSIRGGARERNTRGSRPTSPRPGEDRRHPSSRQERHEDARHTDRRSEVNTQPPRSSFGPSSPSGPRSHRQDRPDRTRAPVDLQHGRLEQEPVQMPQTVNQPTDRSTESDIPSGPRGRGSTSGPRGRPEPPQPQISTQVPSMPSSDRSIPTGPSSKSHTRTASHHDQLSSAGASSPTTPAADTSGLHPSRAHLVAPSSSTEAAPQQQSQSRGPPPSVLTSPPAGPRGGNAPANAPSGPSPTTRGPPSGPHDNSTRGGRNNRHPLTAVNNTLAQAGQGTSGRGRGSVRQNSGQITHQMGPPTPNVGNGPVAHLDAAPSQPESRRGDLFSSSQNGGLLPNGQASQNVNSENSQNEHSGSGRPAPTDRRGELIEASGEGGRQSSRHSSRARTPDRNERRDERRGERDHDRNGRRDHRNEESGVPSREPSGRYGENSSMPPRRSARAHEQDSDPGPGRPPTHDERGDRRGGYERSTRPPGDGPPPRKHGREGEGPPYPGPGGGRGGGMRNASDNKRPRRGG